MNATLIATYLKQYVPIFQDIELLGLGLAYHYTVHADAIEQCGKFLGAPLTTTLDQTQNPIEPNIAVCDPGVVFAYEDLEEAAEEGDCAAMAYLGAQPEIFEVQYSTAVRATHVQEARLGASPTVLISSAEIISFKRLGSCADHYDEGAF